ncbi:zinc metallopeptidase [Candidatus Poribacteria bacterium]|nr:zinc metallopeptidase [Candidatus Poribacteria bacterium]
MLFFDPMYLLFSAPGFLLATLATILTKSTFAKYSQVASSKKITGAQAAREMLQRHGVHGVNIEPTHGQLTDHYDPTTKTLRLSQDVYGSYSLSAVGIACHEAGHAIQHAHKYAALSLRSALVPATNLSTGLAFPAMMLGMFLSIEMFVLFGVVLFSMGVVFALVTLPVEWDASHRAKSAMVEAGLLSEQEQTGASAVLNAAFLTYLAAALTNILILVYYLFRLGILGGSDD